MLKHNKFQNKLIIIRINSNRVINKYRYLPCQINILSNNSHNILIIIIIIIIAKLKNSKDDNNHCNNRMKKKNIIKIGNRSSKIKHRNKIITTSHKIIWIFCFPILAVINKYYANFYTPH